MNMNNNKKIKSMNKRRITIITASIIAVCLITVYARSLVFGPPGDDRYWVHTIPMGTVSDSVYFDRISGLMLKDSIWEYSVVTVSFFKESADGQLINTDSLDINSLEELSGKYFIHLFKTQQIFESNDNTVAVPFKGKMYMVPDVMSDRFIKISDDTMHLKVTMEIYEKQFVDNMRNLSIIKVMNDSMRLVPRNDRDYYRFIV